MDAQRLASKGKQHGDQVRQPPPRKQQGNGRAPAISTSKMAPWTKTKSITAVMGQDYSYNKEGCKSCPSITPQSNPSTLHSTCKQKSIRMDETLSSLFRHVRKEGNKAHDRSQKENIVPSFRSQGPSQVENFEVAPSSIEIPNEEELDTLQSIKVIQKRARSSRGGSRTQVDGTNNSRLECDNQIPTVDTSLQQDPISNSLEDHPIVQNQEDATSENQISGSQDEQFSDNEDVGAHAKKKGRGWTRYTSVIDKDGGKYTVFTLNNIPVGGKSQKLVKFIGIKARMCEEFPLHLTWSKFHDKSFEVVWLDVKRHYEFKTQETGNKPDMYLVQEWCQEKCQERFRDHRYTLKRTWFYPDLPYEQQRHVTPQVRRVSQEQCEKLIIYWCKEENKEMSLQNLENRGKVDRPKHTLGPVSMATKRYEMLNKGQNPTELEVYLESHKNRSGQYNDDKTKELVEKVRDVAEEINVHKSQEPMDLVQVFDSVYGAHHGGYQRGYGSGVKRRDLKKRSTRALIHQEYEELEKQYEMKRQALVEAEAKLAEMKEKVESLRATSKGPRTYFGTCPPRHFSHQR